MKLRIVKENDYFELGKILDNVINIKSNDYGCAIFFGENDYITLPHVSYVEILQEEKHEKDFFFGSGVAVSG